MFSLDETCRVSSCVVLRRVAALNFIFHALTTPLSAQAFLGYDVLETTASYYLKVPIDRRFDNLSGSHHQSHVNCVLSVYGIYVSGQLSRDVIGCWFVRSCCYLL